MLPHNHNPYYESSNLFFRRNRYRRNDEMANPFLMLLGFVAGCVALLSLGIIHIQI